MSDLIRFFKKIELFKDLSDSEIEYFAQFSSIVSFKKGTRIFSTNDTLEYVFLVKSGKIEIFLESHDHKKQILPEVSRGGLIGEMEVFDNHKIIACCDAKTNTTLVQVKKQDFKNFLSSSPIFLDRIFSSTVQKWRNLETQFHQNNIKLNDAIDKIKTDEELLFKQQRQIEEESRLKEIFIENISHELRTPLTIIQGVLESLKIEDNEEIVIEKDLFGKLQNSSSYLLDLINELLDFSQLSKGLTNLNYNWYNTKELHSIMENLITSLPKLSAKELQITYSLPDPMHIFIDIKRIRQILFHLISNSIKFTEQGSIDISILCKDFDVENCLFCINIKDTGIGISEEDQKIIFNKFVRIKNKYYTLRGTGLGLSLVKTLVDLMNGTIEIESTIKKGSEFIIKIPISYKKIESHHLNPSQETNDIVKPDAPNNVLLIDDYEDTHVIVKALLKNYNITIDSLFNSDGLLDTIKKKNYDIILLDILLPEIDGYEILEILRDFYKNTQNNLKRPKIIAFTALRSEIELEKISKCGFDGLLLKPFTKDDLVNSLMPIL